MSSWGAVLFAASWLAVGSMNCSGYAALPPIHQALDCHSLHHPKHVETVHNEGVSPFIISSEARTDVRGNNGGPLISTHPNVGGDRDTDCRRPASHVPQTSRLVDPVPQSSSDNAPKPKRSGGVVGTMRELLDKHAKPRESSRRQRTSHRSKIAIENRPTKESDANTVPINDHKHTGTKSMSRLGVRIGHFTYFVRHCSLLRSVLLVLTWQS